MYALSHKNLFHGESGFKKEKKIFCMRPYPTSSGRCLLGPSCARVCVKSLNTGKQSINGDDLVRAFILKPNAPSCVFSNTKCIIIVYTADANAPRAHRWQFYSGTSFMHTYVNIHRHIILLLLLYSIHYGPSHDNILYCHYIYQNTIPSTW